MDNRTVICAVKHLHNILSETIDLDFILERKSITIDELLEIYEAKSTQSSYVNILKNGIIIGEVYVALYEYLPKLTTKYGFTVEWFHSLGTLNSTAVFKPDIELLLRKCLEEGQLPPV